MNVPKIKGTHNAMKSGMLAAEAVFDLLKDADEATCAQTGLEPVDYERRLKESRVWRELKQIRNVRPSFHSPLGIFGTMAYTALFPLAMRGKEPWTLSHHGADYGKLKPAAECKPIEYPKPNNVTTFDLLTSGKSNSKLDLTFINAKRRE